MDPEVIEINPPPIQRKSKLAPKKEFALENVVDIDKVEDSGDVIFIGEKTLTSNKGKAVEFVSDVYIDDQSKELVSNLLSGASGVESRGPSSGAESSKSFPSMSHNVANLDGHNSDISFDDDNVDDYMDNFSDGMDVDEYALLQAHFDNVDLPSGVEATMPWLPDYDLSQKKEDFTLVDNSSLQPEEGQHSWFLAHGQSKKITTISQDNGKTLSFSQGIQSSKPQSSLGFLPANIPSNVNNFPPGGLWANMPAPKKTGIMTYPPYLGFYNSFNSEHAPLEQVPNPSAKDISGDHINENTTGEPVVTISEEDRKAIQRKFKSFKQFDTVDDFSDHHYAHHSSLSKQPPKQWAKRIQEEWKILEKDLPVTIFVRVYESKMDLLRAVIIGAEGTPYHDGLFFFDIFFPSSYPYVPPLVYYHSGGLRLNPNLYKCGKVCLSLLGTWSGNKTEKWMPGVSTVLQVLVSIQGLILNAKPYFNEPGYEHTSGSTEGERYSLQYNETTFILSLKTMIFTMRRPPKHFEIFVKGHFYNCARDILVACKAYLEGAQVGCLAKGGVQDVDEGDKSCSKQFRESLARHTNMLVKELTQVGAENCGSFLPSTNTGNTSSGAAAGAPKATAST